LFDVACTGIGRVPMWQPSIPINIFEILHFVFASLIYEGQFTSRIMLFMSEFIDFQKQDGLKLLHQVVFSGASCKMS
jgi:hypothetical protein